MVIEIMFISTIIILLLYGLGVVVTYVIIYLTLPSWEDVDDEKLDKMIWSTSWSSWFGLSIFLKARNDVKKERFDNKKGEQ